MLLKLIGIADGRQVRLIEEGRLGGPLRERDDGSAGPTASLRVDGRDEHDEAKDRVKADLDALDDAPRESRRRGA